MFLSTLAKRATIRKSIVHIFEPASERGKKGLDELRQQTVAVLSFHKLKTDVFDAQLSFNMLARYGEEALEPLEGVEQRIERHLASLLAAYPAHSDAVAAPDPGAGVSRPQFLGLGRVRGESRPPSTGARAGRGRPGCAPRRSAVERQYRRAKRIERGRDRRPTPTSLARRGFGWSRTICGSRRRMRWLWHGSAF